MADVTTTIHVLLNRAVNNVIDDVASDGLYLLRKILNESGFDKSEYLKNYELYAHIIGDNIMFEIVLDIEAVLSDDEITKLAMSQEQKEITEIKDKSVKTYNLATETHRVRRMRDKRKPAIDTRKTADDRKAEHTFARVYPRSARVTPTGKLSLAIKRSTRISERNEIIFPKIRFDGIIKKFMDELCDIVLTRFGPELMDLF